MNFIYATSVVQLVNRCYHIITFVMVKRVLSTDSVVTVTTHQQDLYHCKHVYQEITINNVSSYVNSKGLLFKRLKIQLLVVCFKNTQNQIFCFKWSQSLNEVVFPNGHVTTSHICVNYILFLKQMIREKMNTTNKPMSPGESSVAQVGR